MIVYLAHPVGHDPIEREKNLKNVQEWFLWLIHNTNWTINVPWFIYVSNLDETYRKRALRDDLAILSTCDAIALTGGRISEGMQEELGLAVVGNMRVFDLTKIGYKVPQDDSSQLTAKALVL